MIIIKQRSVGLSVRRSVGPSFFAKQQCNLHIGVSGVPFFIVYKRIIDGAKNITIEQPFFSMLFV
jgi:hypothetical protein